MSVAGQVPRAAHNSVAVCHVKHQVLLLSATFSAHLTRSAAHFVPVCHNSHGPHIVTFSSMLQLNCCSTTVGQGTWGRGKKYKALTSPEKLHSNNKHNTKLTHLHGLFQARNLPFQLQQWRHWICAARIGKSRSARLSLF